MAKLHGNAQVESIVLAPKPCAAGSRAVTAAGLNTVNRDLSCCVCRWSFRDWKHWVLFKQVCSGASLLGTSFGFSPPKSPHACLQASESFSTQEPYGIISSESFQGLTRCFTIMTQTWIFSPKLELALELLRGNAVLAVND